MEKKEMTEREKERRQAGRKEGKEGREGKKTASLERISRLCHQTKDFSQDCYHLKAQMRENLFLN